MTRTFAALLALTFAACAPEDAAELESFEADALGWEAPQTVPPQPLPSFEVCNDGRDNDGDGQADERPCRGGSGFQGGLGEGQSIMGSPEGLMVELGPDTFWMGENPDGDIEVEDKYGELVGYIFLPEDTESAHVGMFEDDKGNAVFGMVLDLDTRGELAGAFAFEKGLEGSWSAGVDPDGGKR